MFHNWRKTYLFKISAVTICFDDSNFKKKNHHFESFDDFPLQKSNLSFKYHSFGKLKYFSSLQNKFKIPLIFRHLKVFFYFVVENNRIINCWQKVTMLFKLSFSLIIYANPCCWAFSLVIWGGVLIQARIAQLGA